MMKAKWICVVLCGLFVMSALACGGAPNQIPQCQSNSDCSGNQTCKAEVCTEPPNNSISPLTYKIKEQCIKLEPPQQEGWKTLEISKKDNKIAVKHHLMTHCDADLDFKLERDGNTLKIIEENRNQLTRCTCGYELNMEIGNLPSGKYTIEVWGVKNEAFEAKKLGSGSIDL